MRRKNKRCFTLLEILISMSLTALILFTLTFFYRQVTLMEKEAERAGAQSFSLRYVESRLMRTLPRIYRSNDAEKPSFFFSGEPAPLMQQGSDSLFFTFDHGVQLDKQFSNHVLGRLFVTPNGQLSLATWPAPYQWLPGELPPMKQELLMGDVEKLEIEFFAAPENAYSETERTLLPSLYGSWQPEWKQEYPELPAIIRLKIHQKGKSAPIQYRFPLPNAATTISYDEGAL